MSGSSDTNGAVAAVTTAAIIRGDVPDEAILDPHGRSPTQVRRHYAIEVELAERLRTADRTRRGELYAQVYDELFLRVPDHPQLLDTEDDATRRRRVERKRRLLARFLEPTTRFLEIGSGDGAFIATIASEVTSAVAVDVSEEIVTAGIDAENVRTVLSDGVSIPVDPGTIDVAFSDQLMEHLHPDDARDQLAEIAAAIAPGGWYVLSTPSRLNGPHDVSRYFDDEARGFHLHEYDLAELLTLLRSAGFDRIQVFAGGRGRYVRIPVVAAAATERFVGAMPKRWRHRVAGLLPVRAVLGLHVAAGR